MLLADDVYCLPVYVVISYVLSRMKGLFSVDLDIDQNIPLRKHKFDGCKMAMSF